MMLVGDNTVTGGSDSTDPVYGLNAGNALTIDGDGSLKVTSGNGPEVYGIFARRGLTVENGDITITTGNASSNITYGIYARGENSVVIRGGNITATAGDAPNNISFGVYAYNSMIVEGGILRAYSGNASSDAYGIYADVNLNISGGEVYAEAKTATESYGIYNRSYGSAAMNITGGSVIGVGDTVGIYSETPVLATNAPLIGSDNRDGTGATQIDDWNGTNSTKKWMKIAVPTPHTHSWAIDWTTNATHHWHECENADCTVTEDSEKDGYGEHNYNQEVVSDKYKVSDADCTNSALYYKSCICGKAGTETFTSGSALNHSWKDEWKTNSTHHWHECGNANCPITVDSDKDNYGEHTYENGKCTACDATDPNYKPTSPQTGDNSNMTLWIALLFISGLGIIATTILSRKRKTN